MAGYEQKIIELIQLIEAHSYSINGGISSRRRNALFVKKSTEGENVVIIFAIISILLPLENILLNK